MTDDEHAAADGADAASEADATDDTGSAADGAADAPGTDGVSASDGTGAPSPDPSRDAAAQPPAEEHIDRCAECGAALPDDAWCPATTTRDDDGRTVVHSFCDEACRDAWTGTEDGD